MSPAEKTRARKEQNIDSMTNDQVLNELKEKRLATFGTGNERRERLKKHYGIDSEPGDQRHVSSQQTSSNLQKKSSCRDEIERLKQEREARRARMDEVKRTRTEREKNNAQMGIKADVDFQVLVE
jgi:multidrug resistance efflux pump